MIQHLGNVLLGIAVSCSSLVLTFQCQADTAGELAKARELVRRLEAKERAELKLLEANKMAEQAKQEVQEAQAEVNELSAPPPTKEDRTDEDESAGNTPEGGGLGVLDLSNFPFKPKNQNLERDWYRDPYFPGTMQRRFYDKGWTSYVWNSPEQGVQTAPPPQGPFPPDANARGKWGWNLGEWALDWQVGKAGPRFIFDVSGDHEGEIDVFDDGELTLALDLLNIYSHRPLWDTKLDWGTSAGLGIAATESNASLLLWSAGLFVRPQGRDWQLETGFIQGISGDESLNDVTRDDSGFYVGVSVGALIDSAKETKED